MPPPCFSGDGQNVNQCNNFGRSHKLGGRQTEIGVEGSVSMINELEE